MPNAITVTLSNGDAVTIWPPSPSEMRKINNNSFPNKRADLFTLRLEYQQATPGNEIIVDCYYFENTLGNNMGQAVGEQVSELIGRQSSNQNGSEDCDLLVGRLFSYSDYDTANAKFRKLKDTTPTTVQEQMKHYVWFKVKSIDVNGVISESAESGYMILELPQEETGGPLDGTGMGN